MENSNSTPAIKSRQGKLAEVLEESGWQLCDLQNMPIKGRAKGSADEFLPNKGFIKISSTLVRRMTNGHNMPMTFRLRAVWDVDAGIVYGQPLGLNDKGKPQWKMIFVDTERTFNLARPLDRRDFYTFLHCKEMEGGPNSKGPSKIRMIDPEQEAVKVIETRRVSRKAEDIVDSLKNTDGLNELSDFAIMFGFDPAQSENVLRRLLLEKALSDPNELVKRFDNPDRKIWVIVNKAKLYGVFESHPDGKYFNGLNLGMLDSNVVDRIKQSPEMIIGIEDAIDNKTGKAKLPIAGNSPVETKTPGKKNAQIDKSNAFGN